MRPDPRVSSRPSFEAVYTQTVSSLVVRGSERFGDLPGVTQLVTTTPMGSLLMGRTQGRGAASCPQGLLRLCVGGPACQS